MFVKSIGELIIFWFHLGDRMHLAPSKENYELNAIYIT